MKISKAHIQGFGKFVDKTFTFSQGFNLVYGNNEAGKTTLRNFIFHMLYGQKKFGVRKRLYLPAHQLYSPWHHYTYQGILHYSLEDQPYRIERNFHGDFEEVRVFKEATGEDISALFNQDERKELQFMKEQIGLSERSFENTILIEQNEMAGLLYQNKENIFEELIGKVIYGVEGEQGKKTIREIIGDLEKQKKDIGTLKSKKSPLGLAYENLRIMAEKKYIIENQRESYYRDQECLTQIIEKEKTLQEIEKRIYEVKKYLEGKHLKEKVKGIEKVLYEKQELEKYINKNFSPEIQQGSWENIYKKREKIQKSDRITTLLSGMFLGMGMLFIIWLLLAPNLALQIPMILTCFLFGVWNLLRKKEVNKKTKKLLYQLDKINQYQDAIKEYQRLQERLNEETMEYSLEDLKRKINSMEINEEINPSEMTMNLYQIELELEEIQKQKKNLLEEKIYLDIRVENSQWNPMELEQIQGDMFEIQRNIEEMEKNIEAIEIAISILKKMEGEGKNRWIPSITRQTQKNIYKITQKYHTIKIDDQYKIKTVHPYSGKLISIDQLSWGTFCQFYFSLRVSLVQMLSPKPICLPMILDEPFIYFDNNRLEKSMELLKDLSKEHQIIIFTSQNREEQYLQQNNVEYQCIKLD